MSNTRDVPLFRLPDGGGGQRGTLDFWQRRDMFVVTLHDECDRCTHLAHTLRRNATAWRKEEIELVLVLMPGGATEPRVEGLLIDREGTACRALGEATARPADAAQLIVANRFGQIYAHLDAHRAADTLVAEAVEWMDLAQRQCGECNAPLAWS